MLLYKGGDVCSCLSFLRFGWKLAWGLVGEGICSCAGRR